MTNQPADPDALCPAGAATQPAADLGESILPRSTAEIALNCVGFFIGLLIMTADYVVAARSLTPKNRAFVDSPQAMVWILLVAGEFAFWAIIIEPLWRWRARLRAEHQLRLTPEIGLKMASTVVFFALPGYFLVRIAPDSDLAHHDAKMAIVNLIAMGVALLAVSGIWFVRAALETNFAGNRADGRPEPSLEARIKVLLELRRNLQRFITLLGAMVALSALTRGALRQAFLATGGTAEAFPSEYVLLQGAYFTGLLALVYIPTFTDLNAVGSNLLESAYPIHESALDWENLAKWQANRKSLEELLQLRSGALENLRAGVSILAPTATSIVTVLLGTK